MSLCIDKAVGNSIVNACRVEAMQQGTEGTERFCIKQLLKPVDNVSHPGCLVNGHLASANDTDFMLLAVCSKL